MSILKTKDQIRKLMRKKENIRNVAIVAHVDHGKTTLTDSLLARAGLLSFELAAQALRTDYDEEEQQRGITIFTSVVPLYYEYQGKEYLVHLQDCPGHVDFSAEVTRALRGADGALVLVDALEGIMPQTETVLRQSLSEGVRPVLFINKVDRLISELRLTPERLQEQLFKVISGVNKFIKKYAPPEVRDKWLISPQANNVAFGSAKDKWGFTLRIAQEKGITFKDVYEAYTQGRVKELAQKVPVHDAALQMIIEHLPNPLDGQRYRAKFIWKAKEDNPYTQHFLNCDDNGPVIGVITKVLYDRHVGLVCIGRLFSGTLRQGDEVYLHGLNRWARIQQLGLMVIDKREILDEIPAGNLFYAIGLNAPPGETISKSPDVPPFEEMKYISDPVMTVAIEPKNPQDLTKLAEVLRRFTTMDPSLRFEIDQETGQYLLSGMGELQLETVCRRINEEVPITVSPPIIVYRETITSKSPQIITVSPNGHNRAIAYAEPLEPEVIQLIESGEITDDMDRKEIAKILKEKVGWDARTGRNIVKIDRYTKSIFINATKGAEFLGEVLQLMIDGFEQAVRSGIVAREPMYGIKWVLVDVQIHEDPVHRGPAQILPMTYRNVYGCVLKDKPRLLEPITKFEIKVPERYMGNIFTLISRKRGRILNVEQEQDMVIIHAEIPTAETIGISNELREASEGRAFWGSEFARYEPVPPELEPKVIAEVRKRKGLKPELPDPEEFDDSWRFRGQR